MEPTFEQPRAPLDAPEIPPPPEFSHSELPAPAHHPHRKIFVLLLVCVVTVGVLAGIKLAREDASLAIPRPSFQGSASGGSLSVDPSFYVPSGATRPPAAKPVSPVPVISKPAAPSNGVSADAYLIGNVATGEVYAEKNGTTPLPIASMSKLMTAMIATNTMSPTTTVAITPLEASVYPDLSHIGAGESFSMKEMLYPLLLDSSNIAAEALASTTNRIRFLDLMNSYAWEIGLPTTFFADPSGLSPLNQASAEGFFDLAQYVYRSRPDLLAITRTASTSVATTTEHAAHDFVSIHPFVSDPRFIGGKTGHTDEAGDTMLTILDIGGQPIAFIVLHSSDRARDTALLADQIGKTLASK